MTAPASEDVARECFRWLGTAAAGGDVDRVMEYCADDVRLEFPFAEPAVVAVGREAARDLLRSAFARFRFTLSEPETYLAGDVLFCEFTSRGIVLATGGPYARRYLALVRVRDGKVDLFRAYFHPSRVAEDAGLVSCTSPQQEAS